jgi:hypothetical protein
MLRVETIVKPTSLCSTCTSGILVLDFINRRKFALALVLLIYKSELGSVTMLRIVLCRCMCL